MYGSWVNFSQVYDGNMTDEFKNMIAVPQFDGSRVHWDPINVGDGDRKISLKFYPSHIYPSYFPDYYATSHAS